MLLDQILERSAQRHPEKEALICSDRRASYAEINTGANALAHAFRALGLLRQERVAIYFDNSIETVQGIFATMKAAGIFLVINPQVRGQKLSFILKDCNVRILLTGIHNLVAVAPAVAACPDLRHIVLFDGTLEALSIHGELLSAAKKSLHLLQDLLKSYPQSTPPNPNISLDLASLIYTSGSTSQPKGVMLTHLNMITAVTSLTTYLCNEPDDIILSPLPISFDYGLYQVLMAFHFGGTVVLEKQFMYPQAYIDLISKEKVTGLPIVPTITAILLNLKDLGQQDFSTVRYVTNTAQALPEHHIRHLRQMLPKARIYSMYGLTECKRVAYLPPELIDKKPNSVGAAIPDTEVWIEDDEGSVVEVPGEVGELIVRGAHVMVGYWNRPQETEQFLRAGRYPYERELRTGDLFSSDEDGDLYFISRKDDLIKTAGERVGPREIESVLYELEGIMEVAVIGVPDEILGSAVKAFLVLREGMSLRKIDVVRHCQQRLERHMVPKYVDFMQELPKTSTGKINKKDLS